MPAPGAYGAGLYGAGLYGYGASGSPGAMGSGQAVAQYALYVRDNNRRLVGQVDQFNQFEYISRFNAVGNWSLDIDADTPMAGYLATRGYGLVVNRSIVDATTGAVTSSSVLMSGPIRGWSRQMQDNKLVVSGLDDLCWLAMRQAWPITVYPYSALMLGTAGLLRYYRLDESSGTTAVDAKSGVNGTYTATGVTYSQPAGIDDTNTSITLNGTSGRISIPTTSLPTGNAAWTMGAWVNLASNPAANAYVVSYGANTTLQNPLLYVTTSGQIVASAFGAGDCGFAALTTGAWAFVAATYDGTSLRCYVNGAQVGSTTTPGAMTTPGSGLSGSIGSNNAGSGNFFPGGIDEAFIASGALSAATLLNLYQVGFSRFASSAYDARTGAAETLLHGYVNDNCVATTLDPIGRSRVIPGLTLAADGGRGSSVSGNARYDALVNKDGTGLLQQLALSSSPPLGFTVTQSGTSLVFSVYVPNDKTGSIIFSQELGNVADFTYGVDAPDIDSGGNVAVVAGGGQGTLRTITLRADGTGIVNWGRIETFIDARDTSDPSTLAQRGDAALAQTSETTSFGAVLAPTESMVYGRDFGLGDTVTVVVDGVAFTDIVREADIALTPDGAETVTPAIGTPMNASPKDAMAKLSAQLKALRAQLARLQKAQ